MDRSRLGVVVGTSITALLWAQLAIAQPQHNTASSGVEPNEESAQSADFSIVNGQVAAYEQMPAFIQLVVKDSVGKLNHNCGGTLIDDEWVLSAAHCFWNYRLFLETGQVQPLPLGNFYAVHPSSHEERQIDRVIFPDEIQTIGWGADLALVHVSKAFSTKDRATLPTPNLPKPFGGVGTVWGKGNAFKVAPNRYVLDSKDIYESKLRKANVTLNRSEFCGEDKPGADLLCAEVPSKNGASPASCTGDSGGPLTIFSDDIKRQIQIGIVSHADAPDDVDVCGGQPTWYSNVSQWTPWIQRHVPKVRTASYALNPDGSPTLAAPQPPTALQCGAVQDAGSPVPSADGPTLVYQPARGASAGSAVSVAGSRLAWPTGRKPKGVVIAGECAWADALAATSLAAEMPLLLTNTNQLDPEVAVELDRLGVREVTLLGGNQAVSAGVETTLKTKGLKVTRVQGASRVGTAAVLATRLSRHANPKSAILARAYPAPGGSPSQAFADSLAAAYWAPSSGAPVLLSDSSTLSTETATALNTIKPRTVNLLGGTGALSTAIESAVRTTTANGTVVRFAGASRADTAATIGHARLSDTKNPAKGVLVVEGQADDAWKAGFTFAGLAVRTNSVYALASGDTLAPESIALIKAAKAKGLPVRCVASTKACSLVKSL